MTGENDEKYDGDTWDYLVDVVDRHSAASDPDHLRARLTSLGERGWRLVLARDDELIFTRLASKPKPPPEAQAVRGTLTIQGASMGLTVDTTPGAEKVVYGFEDDKGNARGGPAGDGSGLTASFTPSDASVTVGTPGPDTDAAGNPTISAPITVVTTVPDPTGPSFTAVLENVSGVSPVLDDDGSTVWVDPPASDPVPITAGEAVEGTLSVASS